ncbi:hypothetical protein QBC34DRAFT_377619 [Podospora aff. communis PSN243]|uniref:Transporter n=1 Tax=Podospora aff. communis PSN243 TaxID=3040156 RepID=A0AAV9GXH1_9PEZI|nr:hypothetical protein QBC34DRAFT_377619 [Podospora aff. communis PSN243]
MTMVFLPGTFLATLFAIPSLRWDSDSVIQDNFWVYWAFAIPATLLVLVFWVWLSDDGPTWPSLSFRKHRRANNMLKTPSPRDGPRQRKWAVASLVTALRHRIVPEKMSV